MAATKQEAEKWSVAIGEDDAKAIAQGQALIAPGKTKVDGVLSRP